jgi:uncharacterized protein
MPISMYQASVPVAIHMLENLAGILRKGAAHAEAKGFDADVLYRARLAPDMFPLFRQVQIATDVVKGCAARLAGEDPPVFEDTESDFAELLTRIDKIVAYLKSFRPEQIDGSEERSVVIRIRGESVTFQGLPYLFQFVLPNLYFHAATTYNILRHNGVELGKKDFLGGG